MRRRLRLSVQLALLALIGCAGPQDRAHARGISVTTSLRSLAARHRGDTLSIASATVFPWDRCYVFEPYTPSARVAQVVGHGWKDPADVEARDDINLLVFVQGDSVIAWEAPKRDLELEMSSDGTCTPSNSLFRVEANTPHGPFTLRRIWFGKHGAA